MTEQIRRAPTFAKAFAVILTVGFICLASPLQDSGPAKAIPESPRKSAGEATPTTPNGAREPDTSGQTSPQNAGGAGIAPAVPPTAEGSKDPAGGLPTARSTSSSPPEKPGAGIEKAPGVQRGVPDDYQIGAGDVLHIGVFHEPDATVQSVVVRTDGKISMPLVKEVSVLGLTPSQLEKQITEQLSKFLTAPDVTVIVTSINSKKIYVIGAVRREGPLTYSYPMNVLQALIDAGGLADFAKRKKIYVLRTTNGRSVKLPFDYDAAIKGEHLELNVPVMPGDTIVVPGSQ